MPTKDGISGTGIMPGRSHTRRVWGSASHREAKLDDALDESFPASDPLAFTPRRAGQHDWKAPITEADAFHGLKGLVRRLKYRIKH